MRAIGFVEFLTNSGNLSQASLKNCPPLTQMNFTYEIHTSTTPRNTNGAPEWL